MRTSARPYHVISILVVLVVLMAGCESANDDAVRPTNTPAVSALVNQAAQPTATSADAPPTSTEAAPPTKTAAPEPPPIAPGEEAQVLRIIDGDTIEVRLADGSQRDVRLIGIDTPETKHPDLPVMCYGVEATAETTALVQLAEGRVILEKDVSETDQYDRLLRYVWLPHPDGVRMLNYELVARGFAQVATFPPDVKYQEMFLAGQDEARNGGRGYWSACGGAINVPAAPPTPVPTPTPVPAPTQPPPPTPTPAPPPPPPPPSSNCDPSYPGVCIPPYSQVGDLDCGDIPFRRFQVIPPDPHGFDADYDGVGCESG